jgi:clan AA aspartic protease
MSSLVRHLGLAGIVSGPDFAVGKDREGDLPELTRLGEELGYTVTVMEPIGEPAHKISSSAIRNAIGSGEMDAAARLLGRPYSTRGKVVHGAARGRTLGYPTANLRIEAHVALPGDGIYATRARTDGGLYQSASYIGSQPTFNGSDRSVEVFLLDFEGDLYGDDLEVEWVEKVRDDKRFDSLDNLVFQMKEDVKAARYSLQRERLRMGFTRKSILIRNPETGQDAVVRALVDSGTNHTVLPQDVAAQLGLRSRGRQPYELADGRTVTWDQAFIEVTIAGRTGPTVCVYSEQVPEALLGVHALEAVDLGLDPVGQDFIELPRRIPSLRQPS